MPYPKHFVLDGLKNPETQSTEELIGNASRAQAYLFHTKRQIDDLAEEIRQDEQSNL